MGLILSRPEKSEAMSRLVNAIREAAVGPARDNELNLAEVINAFGQAFASILVGAYREKERKIVLAGLPDLIEAYYPKWEKIYAKWRAEGTKRRGK